MSQNRCYVVFWKQVVLCCFLDFNSFFKLEEILEEFMEYLEIVVNIYLVEQSRCIYVVKFVLYVVVFLVWYVYYYYWFFYVINCF